MSDQDDACACFARARSQSESFAIDVCMEILQAAAALGSPDGETCDGAAMMRMLNAIAGMTIVRVSPKREGLEGQLHNVQVLAATLAESFKEYALVRGQSEAAAFGRAKH